MILPSISNTIINNPNIKRPSQNITQLTNQKRWNRVSWQGILQCNKMRSITAKSWAAKRQVAPYSTPLHNRIWIAPSTSPHSLSSAKRKGLRWFKELLTNTIGFNRWRRRIPNQLWILLVGKMKSSSDPSSRLLLQISSRELNHITAHKEWDSLELRIEVPFIPKLTLVQIFWWMTLLYLIWCTRLSFCQNFSTSNHLRTSTNHKMII